MKNMRKMFGISVMAAFIILALAACNHDGDSGGGGRGGGNVVDTHQYRLSNPLQAIDNLYKGNYGMPRGTLFDIEVYKGDPSPDDVSNHIQGYGKYGDWHILTHSNLGHHMYVVGGEIVYLPGYIYFYGELSWGHPNFRIDAPDGIDYAHPGGIQVIGDFMVGASTPDNNDREAIIWMYDLTPLNEYDSIHSVHKPLTLTPRIFMTLDTQHVSAVGITDIQANILYNSDSYTDSLATGSQKKYMLAVHRYYDHRTDIYISSPTNSLWNASFKLAASISKTSVSYDGMSLIRDTNDDIWLFGFWGTGEDEAFGFASFVDIYKLTTEDDSDPSRRIITEVSYKSQEFSVDRNPWDAPTWNVSMRYGTSLQVLPNNEIIITATQRNIDDNGPNFTFLNTFKK